MGEAKRRGTYEQRRAQAQQENPQLLEYQTIMAHFNRMAPGFDSLLRDRDTARDLGQKIQRHLPYFREVDAEVAEGTRTWYHGHSTQEFGRDHTSGHYFISIWDRQNYTGNRFTHLLSAPEAHQARQMVPDIDQIDVMAEIEWMPVYTTRHALQRWRERTHLDNTLLPGSAEYLTARIFQDEFRMRGAPCQRHWGCPVEDGIFLGEWITRQEMQALHIAWDKEIGSRSFCAWKHSTSTHIFTDQGIRLNPMSHISMASTYQRPPDEWFFLAKTFISYRDASFGQTSLAMSYDKDPEINAQQFRRSGAEEWIDHTRPSVLTTKARSLGVLQ